MLTPKQNATRAKMAATIVDLVGALDRLANIAETAWIQLREIDPDESTAFAKDREVARDAIKRARDAGFVS